MDDRVLALQISMWIEEHLDDPCDGRDLERVSGYSDNRLREKFHSVTGETPSSYIRKRRLTEAAKALLAGEAIVDVAFRYGYSSQENFTTAFKSWFGLNPGELRAMDGKYRVFVSRMKEPLSIMEFLNLKQPPLASTLMSCVKGASDFLDLDWSTPKLFGYSTMGMLINMHTDLCPSSPYVWNKEPFYLRLRDLGIRRVESFCVQKSQGESAIAEGERKLRAWLDAGKIAMMEFLECQLVLGYDAQGLVLQRAWGDDGAVSEIKQLTFGSWFECLDREGWVQFTLLERDDFRADEPGLLRSALGVALRLRTHPADFATPGYCVGDAAWHAWIDGVGRGLGAGHGHWWNGMVWRECRAMAADFFVESEPLVSGERQVSICRDLTATYRECAARLEVAARREESAEVQAAALGDCRRLDAKAESLTRELIAAL
jgi:AraC-like DNA-binding protein